MSARIILLTGPQSVGKSVIAGQVLARLVAAGQRAILCDEEFYEGKSAAALRAQYRGLDALLITYIPGVDEAPSTLAGDIVLQVEHAPANASKDQLQAAELTDVWTTSGPLALAWLRPAFSSETRPLVIDVSRLARPAQGAAAQLHALASQPFQTPPVRRPT